MAYINSCFIKSLINIGQRSWPLDGIKDNKTRINIGHHYYRWMELKIIQQVIDGRPTINDRWMELKIINQELT